MPLTQLGVAPEHTVPHAPQFTAVVVDVSQPLVRLSPSQSAKPPAHVPLHTPPEHVRVAMLLELQGEPHAPQWSGSVDVSTHVL